jgi:hypothetical protein
MSVPCELALVQHASLVAKPELAALGDLRVRIVFDLERKIVNCAHSVQQETCCPGNQA